MSIHIKSFIIIRAIDRKNRFLNVQLKNIEYCRIATLAEFIAKVQNKNQFVFEFSSNYV